MNVLYKILNKITKLRLNPIRVFCFHQVSDLYDANQYCRPDWISTKDFKRKIYTIQEKGYKFISLTEAYNHIKNDKFRLEKYAVLTCDDGLTCQSNLLPWLETHNIPLTMFVTLQNLDGETCGEQILHYFKIKNKDEECALARKIYLNKAELFSIKSDILEIGMHGFKHQDMRQLSNEEFLYELILCHNTLCEHPNYIPFFAYPYGQRNDILDMQLHNNYFIPVLMDGKININESLFIHRELL